MFKKYLLIISLFVDNSLGLIGTAQTLIRRPGIVHSFPRTRGEIWPKPLKQFSERTYYIVQTQSLVFQNITYTCDLLEKAFQRYRNILKLTTASIERKVTHDIFTLESDPFFSGYLEVVKVNLKKPCEHFPYLNMDESYTFTTFSEYALLESNSIWGILRGLESFSQMLTSNNDILIQINSTYIEDSPRFSHRGLLVDTSRHYISVPMILKILDGMAYNKLNVFHWHIVDDESFPYQSIVYPELSAQGAYIPAYVYNITNVQEIIEYARLLGIRVIVGVDSPAHTRSWGVSHPEILTACEGNLEGKYGPLDPTSEDTYEFIDNFWDEIVEIFPDKYVHIGGDDAEFDCWRSNTNISKFMDENGLTQYEQLEELYMQRVVDKFQALGATNIVWHEVLIKGVNLPNGTFIHIARGNRKLLTYEITARGHPILISDCWFLGRLSSGGDWEQFYNCDPHDFHGKDYQKSLVMGGEACMWSEFVDESNILQTIFPRVCAVAEKLWSEEDADVISEAQYRLEEQTCRLIIRGISAAPPNGPGFCYL